MSSTSAYRTNAEACLRKAAAVQDEREKPFWLVLAQSWLHLAEHVAARDEDEPKSDEQQYRMPRAGWSAH
jgi:putative IMPACT (imprinted ancient) family translation regulator